MMKEGIPKRRASKWKIMRVKSDVDIRLVIEGGRAKLTRRREGCNKDDKY